MTFMAGVILKIDSKLMISNRIQILARGSENYDFGEIPRNSSEIWQVSEICWKALSNDFFLNNMEIT